ncbi:hypothetical protein BLNAU_23909 [Blattamonas nauphoetae]|uniref:Uncharacterized protein n=1 Tax=Blattamonas nauphoetae TaxID=2049346 RepID=A0ABQ9WNZ1_9EUKA|nr:hypothetical protein BLNAU_23909 [Blattamonas nauphoetae]
MASENRTVESTELSLVSNQTDSLRTSTSSPHTSQRAGGDLRGRHLSLTSVNTVQLSPIPLGHTNYFPEFTPEDDTSKRARQTEEEFHIVSSLLKMTPRTPKQHSDSWNLLFSQKFSINPSQIDINERFDDTLFLTPDNVDIELNLQKCILILYRTGRADHLVLNDRFVDSLCDCVGGGDDPCSKRSIHLLTILFNRHLGSVLQQHVLDKLQAPFADLNHYQMLFLMSVYRREIQTNSQACSFSDVNWEAMMRFKASDYHSMLYHMEFVSDAVWLFSHRGSLDAFNPQKIVRGLVENYALFSLTDKEVAEFSKTAASDYLTSLFTTIVLFSVILNQPLPPHITELYAATEPEPVAMSLVNLFLVPLTHNLGTTLFSSLLLERFVRHRAEGSLGEQIHAIHLGVKHHHFDTASLLVLLHPFFVSRLWHLDVVAMMLADSEQADKAVHVLRLNFSLFRKPYDYVLILYATHPPPQFGPFLDSMITFTSASHTVNVDFFVGLFDFVGFCSPFGDGQLFQHLIQTLLSPLTPNGSQYGNRDRFQLAIRWLQLTGTWLPKGFDNPLRRLITPSTLSTQPLTRQELNTLKGCVVGRESWTVSVDNDGGFVMSNHLDWLSIVARMGHWEFDYLEVNETYAFVKRLLLDCFSSFPAFVSVALLALSNIVANTGPSVHIILCQANTVAVVICSVAQSMHLDDYEAGLRIVSGLLRSLQLTPPPQPVNPRWLLSPVRF